MHVGPGGIRTSQSWFVGKTSSLENFVVTFLREREKERGRRRQRERERERAERMEDRNTEREKQINNPNDRKKKGHRYTDMDV